MYDPFPHFTIHQTNDISNLRRNHNHHNHKHLPRTNRQTLRDDPSNSREAYLLCLRPVSPAAHRPVLVWVDVVPVHPVDRANAGGWMRGNGDFLGLFGCF